MIFEDLGNTIFRAVFLSTKEINKKLKNEKQQYENETWEQTEKILKSMIQEKLEIEDVNIEKAHRVDNTSNTSPRTVVAKFSSFKGKQLVLSAAKKLKGQNIYFN